MQSRAGYRISLGGAEVAPQTREDAPERLVFRAAMRIVLHVAVLSLAACGSPSHQSTPVDGGWQQTGVEQAPREETPAAEVAVPVMAPAEQVEERTAQREIRSSSEPPSELPEASEPAGAAGPLASAAPPSLRLAYDERRPKSVIDLQPWRDVHAMDFATDVGREGVATLMDLNPSIGAWFLLRLEWVGGGDPEVYHLENPFPLVQRVRLDPKSGSGLLLTRDGEDVACDLWSAGPVGTLVSARKSARVFAPLCGDWLYLRNPTAGHRTPKEWAADFLRDRVWGGEKITTLVRDTIFAGRYRRKGKLSGGSLPTGARVIGEPEPPALAAGATERRIEPDGLGLSVEREPGGMVEAGRWYPVTGAAGVFVSALRPDMVADEIVERQGTRVNALEPKEASSLVYVVAFDLARLELRFALGTEHPRVGWSERALDSVRDESLPGPDGIGTVAPLVRTGVVSPAEAVRVAATFTGGFKRSHGAFNQTELATTNEGSHYGFIEQGVVLSKLQPNLSTLAVFGNGRVFLGSWSTDMNSGLPGVRYARQNGVPILERDPASGRARPGGRVKQWGAGNWSGSVDKKLRTLRSGACLQEGLSGTFLLYGFFTSSTPSGMARVFEAYGCTEAMLLDMNALEHTYLAVYREKGDRREVERLIDEMKVLDKVVGDETVPRFVGFPDNRDFFFLLRRPQP